MTSMEEEVASSKARKSVLDLFLVPVLRWRSCSMFLVRYATLLTPPRGRAEDGGGVWIRGGQRPGPRAVKECPKAEQRS